MPLRYVGHFHTAISLMNILQRSLIAVFLLVLFSASGLAQPPTEKKPPEPPDDTGKAEAVTKMPDKVEVKPVARDDEIADRLTRILKATDWFRDATVTVNEGVVFLRGQTSGEPFKKWAGDLARNTRDVVAVVNQIAVDAPPIWDSSEVRSQLTDLGRSMVSGLPVLVFALVVLTTAWFISRFLSRVLRRLLNNSIKNDLLRRVTAYTVGLIVFLLAVYLVLQVSGLTRLALTLAGGTGLIGLALGIAFKEISENFLASIYLSIQKPFEVGDLVEITGQLGFVQRITARTTILMALDGNHVQIPNATVFKNTLRNFTSNPNRRVDFTIGVGYEVAIAEAQIVALQVLRDHPAVLKDPEPWVLVEGLGASTVNLRVYFWLDGRQHSWLKVLSAVIRLTKGAFQQAGITLPDESREIVFPNGVPVHIIEKPKESKLGQDQLPKSESDLEMDPQPMSSAAEGGLTSEAGEIEKQAKYARMPEAGDNLLDAKAPHSAPSNPTPPGS